MTYWEQWQPSLDLLWLPLKRFPCFHHPYPALSSWGWEEGLGNKSLASPTQVYRPRISRKTFLSSVMRISTGWHWVVPAQHPTVLRKKQANVNGHSYTCWVGSGYHRPFGIFSLILNFFRGPWPAWLSWFGAMSCTPRVMGLIPGHGT